jgi:hypothetical protein
MAWSSRVSSWARVSRAANQHGQAIVPIGGGCDAANGMLHSDGDFAVGNQFGDMGESPRNHCGVLLDNLFF